MGGTLDGDGARWFDRFVTLYERADLSDLGYDRIKDAEALREAGWCLVLTQAVYELEQGGASSRRVELPPSLRGPLC